MSSTCDTQLRDRSLEASTTRVGCWDRAAVARSSIGVSAPKNEIRHPCWRSSRPNMIKPDVVALAGRPREHRERPSAPPPATREREQSPSDQVRREMLGRDRNLSGSPARAQIAQVGDQHLRQRRVEAEPAEQVVQHALRGRLVEIVERGAKPEGQIRDPAASLRSCRTVSSHGRLRGFAGRQSSLHVRQHPADALFVLAGVETEAAAGSARAQETVAPLPRTQRLDVDPRSAGELPDPYRLGRHRRNYTGSGQAGVETLT